MIQQILYQFNLTLKIYSAQKITINFIKFMVKLYEIQAVVNNCFVCYNIMYYLFVYLLVVSWQAFTYWLLYKEVFWVNLILTTFQARRQFFDHTETTEALLSKSGQTKINDVQNHLISSLQESLGRLSQDKFT